jgi:hypothetical protein
MDQIKIANFPKAYSGRTFPRFRSLSLDDAGKIKSLLADRLGMRSDISGLELVCAIPEKAQHLSNMNAEDADFNLDALFKQLELHPQRNIYINWCQFDDVDEMEAADLIRYFDDVWYPAADAIELFDDSLSWILAVDYSGNLSYLKLD